jgi:hypothetical protein
MNRIDLKLIEHDVKVGDVCGSIAPNITEDTIFLENGEPIGFYIKDISKHSVKLQKLIDISNAEFNSKRVPKSEMRRSSGLIDKSQEVRQYSTIIGSVPKKANMRRNTHWVSSVHAVDSAKTFVKAMTLAAIESEQLIKQFCPNVYSKQRKIIAENIPKEWRMGNLFTSSISNYNIAAPFHTDKANLRDCVNVIIIKKEFATGGNTTVPDYGATMDSCNNSMLVYPAWKSLHGVTPIINLREDGYRNSLVFYPLRAFKNE